MTELFLLTNLPSRAMLRSNSLAMFFLVEFSQQAPLAFSFEFSIDKSTLLGLRSPQKCESSELTAGPDVITFPSSQVEFISANAEEKAPWMIHFGLRLMGSKVS